MSIRQEELSKLFDRKYGETKIDSSAGSNLSPRQREIEDLFNKMSIRNGVSSFDDLNNYFENSTKAVNSARDYYNNGTAGRRRASELEKIKETALKLDDFTEKKDSSASVMAVGGYMTREGSARSEYLKKQGYNSLKELEDAIQKAQTSDKYDRNFGSEYEAELEDAYSGGQSALKFIEQNKDSFEDYDKLHAQLSDYLEGIKDLTDAMKGVRDYYGQWDNEDVYKNGYGVLKTAEKTLESAWESIKGGYTGASAAMSASKQGSLSIGQSAQAARENKTDEEALEEINEQRRQRADEKMKQAAKYFDNAGSAEMLATWQKNAMGKLLVDVGTQVPALAGDIALSAAGSLVGMPQAGLVSMGVRAYGQGAYDARQKGLSWEKSELAGIKSAAIEVVTEKLLGGATKFAYGKGWIDNTLDAGIEKALSRMGASKNLTKGIGYLVDAGEEGVEEMISDVLNPIADRILSLQNENGKYLNDFDISDMFYDGMVGFVLGLAGTSVNAASSSVKSIRENKEFKKLGSEYVDELLKKSAKYTPESKIAKTINEKKSKGKEISGREIKQLTTETNEAIEKADIQKIEQSVKGQLEKYGEKVSVPELATAIAKQTAGQELSKAETQLIEDSVYGQRVVNELDPVNIRSGEYTSDWVQNIGTELVNAEQYNKPEEENKPLPLQDAPAEEQPVREIKEPLPAMDTGEQEQFIRDRYAEQVKNGTFTEDAVQGMIEELHDGISLESIINRVDNNIKEIENERNDSSDGSMGRELGGSSAEQSGAVQESAGRSESPKRSADRGTKEVRRNSEKANARQVSAKSLGLSNGTDTAKLSVVEKNKLSKTSQIISTISGAKSVTVVKGSLEVTDESGTVHRVSGVKTGDGRIIVRGDHPLYTTEQLLLHETEHMYETDDMLEEMRAAVIEVIGEPALNELCMQYAVKWGGLYTEEDMYGVASMKEKEVYADALAGISRANTRGTKKITLAVRKVFYKHTGLDIDALLADEQPTVTEAKQNEAQSTVTEPKAQAPPQYSIESLPDGKKYVRADRQVIFGNDPDAWSEQLENYINCKIRKGEDVPLVADDGDVLLLTKETAGKISSPYKDGRTLSEEDFSRKVSAGAHIDELARISKRGNKVVQDENNRHGEMAEGGWNYRTAYFLDFDGKYYRCVISVSIGKNGNAVYNIGEMKERSFSTAQKALSGSSAKSGALGRETSSEDSIRKTNKKVNSYSVDEDLPINLQLVLNGDFDSKRNELHIGTTSNFLTEQIGAEALDLYMPAEKAYRAMATEGKAIRDGKPVGQNINYHGLGKNGLIEILNASEQPIAAFAAAPSESGKRENRIVLVTDVKADGGLGVVIEEVDTYALKGGKHIRANKSITVYPKSNVQSAIQEAMADNRILYLDEKRSQAHLPVVKGSNYPTVGRKADFSNNIRSFWDNVKWKKSGKTEMSFDSNTKTEPEWKKKLREYNTEDSYSVDDATAAEEEAQHRRAFQKAIESEGVEKLKERKATLEKIIGSYKISKGAKSMAKNRVRELESYTKDLECIEEELKKRAVERKEAAQLLEKQKELSDKLANYDGADDTLLETANELEAVNAELERRKGRTLQALNMRKVVIEGKMQYYNKLNELSSEQRAELVSLENELSGVNSEIDKKSKKTEVRNADKVTAAEAAASAVDSLDIRQITAQSRKVLRQQIYDQYGIVSGRKDIGETIDAFADKWISQGKISMADIKSFEDALMQSGAFRVESANDEARYVRSWMRNGQISVPQHVKEEFGDDWNSVRKRAFGTQIYLSVDSGHAGIDQWTNELAGTFGEGVFDDTVDLKTQLERIIDIAEDGKDEHLTVYQMAEHMRKTQGKDAADAYLEDMHEQLISALKSFALDAKIEMESTKRSTYQKVRDDTLRREKAERAAEERARREIDHKALKQVQWLKRNRKYVNQDMQAEIDKLIAGIDTIAVSAAKEMNYIDAYQVTWEDLPALYKKWQGSDNFFPDPQLERIISRVKDKKIGEMDLTDVENLLKAAIALRTEIYNHNNVIGDMLHRTFQEAYDSSKNELIEAKKPNDTTAVTQKIWDSQLNPIHRVNRMFGWKEDSVGFKIFGRELEKGERATKRYVEQATQMLDPWLEKHKDWVSKADGQGKNAIWYELKVPELVALHNGDKPIFGNTFTVYMTPMQKIQLYLESKNFDNLSHMVGGRSFVDKALYSKGKKDEAFGKLKNTIRLAPETVKKIVSDMTKEELELAKILDGYYNGYAKENINRVSNILYGYDKAMSENYAPIFTNRNYNKSTPGVYDDGTAEGVGHLKGRIPRSSTPTYNLSALDAFRQHVSQTSRFVGMAIPAKNAQTLLNWKNDGVTTQALIADAWSNGEAKALEKTIAELQSPTYLEQSEFSSLFGKLMSNYIGGIFGANFAVAAKVLASKPTAAIVLGNQYYPNRAQVKNTDTKFISKYTSELDVRIRGYGTPEVAALVLSQSKYMKFVQNHKPMKLTVGGGLLQAADIHVVKTMWPWAENKVRAEYPELEIGTQEEIDSGNSPFYKKVAEVFENAVGDTQSMYDIMHRSTILRDTDEITRSFTIFHTDSLQAMNLIRLRAGQLEAAKQDAKKADSEETKAATEAKIKTAAKVLGQCIGNIILMNTVVTLFDILRDLFMHRLDKYENDEGEDTFWSFVESSFLQLAENTSGMIIGADIVVEGLASWITHDKYYDHEIIAIKAFNDLRDLFTDTKDALAKFVGGYKEIKENNGDVWEYIAGDGDARGAIKTAAEKIAHFFGGIPIENVEKLIVNAIGWVFPEVSAAYSGIWETPSKKGLSKSRSLETDIKSLYSTKKTDISDETAEELARLYEAGYKDAIISDTPPSVNVDGEEIELNEAQRQAYNAAAGKALKHLEAVISSEEYSSADDEGKAKLLSRLNEYAKKLAKAAVTDTELEAYAAGVPDWLDVGMSWGQITSNDTDGNNTISKYMEAGVERRVAREVVDTIASIETEEGKNPSTVQKVKSVAYMTVSEDNKEAALSVVLKEKAYARYMAARKCGVSSVDYADFLEILDRVDENGGNPKKAEFEEAVKRADLNRSAAAAIWKIYWPKSTDCPW